MGFLNSTERAFAEAISAVGFCNPFLPERIEHERAALGHDFVEHGTVWTMRPGVQEANPNVPGMTERAGALSEKLRERLTAKKRVSRRDLNLYEDLVLVFLYNRFQQNFQTIIERPTQGKGSLGKVGFYRDFAETFEKFFGLQGLEFSFQPDPAHIFACFFQLRRAFHHIFANIIGISMPLARLRAAVWQSIFTHDMRRYRRVLYERMGDMTCLITGPSGTGKELVARAIALSRYIPFDPASRMFAEDFTQLFHVLNLSAIAPTLIESELFGHRRGAFTGALQDRTGWLENCGPSGTVFLDEIGELDPNIQVKLLRVLQGRTFERLGETKTRTFQGKIIAATNRDLAEEIRKGAFREDFYYRLCSDIITTPSLHEQLSDSYDDLRTLILFIVKRIIGEKEAEVLSDDVQGWIGQNLGRDYRWPGNVRELEQCVRNVLIRKVYNPVQDPTMKDPRVKLASEIDAGSLTAEEVLSRYCTLVYAQTNNFQEAARRLQLDHRTVKSKIDHKLLEQLRLQ